MSSPFSSCSSHAIWVEPEAPQSGFGVNYFGPANFREIAGEF